MKGYVRVRKLDDLATAVDRTGLQSEIAEAAGLSRVRVHELYRGVHDVLEVRKARSFETVLHVPLGTLFIAVDAELLAPYMLDQHDVTLSPIPAGHLPVEPTGKEPDLP
jgi:hypothetical protein